MLAVLAVTGIAAAQARPGLAFREDWKETPAATPVTQAHVANPDLLLTVHGPGADLVKKAESSIAKAV